MYLRIGSLTRPFNEATAAISYAPIYDAKKVMIQVSEQWQISGRVVLQTNATQTRMTAALNRLRQDFDQVRPSLMFLEDDGVTETALSLNASECIDGPNVDASGFPNDGADIYATGMSYNVTITATRALTAGGANPVMEFSEEISTEPGGTELGFVGGAINYPELQVFMQNKPYYYTQSGSIVGLYGYAIPPAPLWPQYQLKLSKPTYIGPRNLGRVNTMYETRYEYTFGSLFPLVGLPHSL